MMAENPAGPENILSTREQQVFDNVLMRLKETGLEHVDKVMLIQFVRGYSYDEKWEDKTFEMMSKALEWRQTYQIDSLTTKKLDKRAIFKNIWSTLITGKNPQGKLIVVDRIGKIDPNALMETFKIEEIQIHHAQTQELTNRMKGCSDSDRLRKVISIIDLDGVGFGHLSANFRDPGRSLMDIDQWYYPEGLDKMYIVNAPFAFRAIWALVSPWLHPRTRAKIQVCGSNYLNELAENGIDKDQLPDFLGGTGVDRLSVYESELLKD